jgi:hypothetical protein
MKELFKKIFLIILLLTSYSFPQTNLTDEQKEWLSKVSHYEKNGWIYLHIEGKPFERGFQHGYTLAKEIYDGIRATETTWHYKTALGWDWLVETTGKIYTPKTDKEILEEIDGIAEGVNAAGYSTSRDELVAYNAAVELRRYWLPTKIDSLKLNLPEEKKEACSSFIATGSMTADGGIVLGHNTMGGYYEPLCRLIIDIVPEKGHRIFMQSCAGYVHSYTDFFITDAGLVGSETTIGGFYPFDPKDTPEFSRMRQATQYASSIDEWCEIMKKNNNGAYANAWLLGDINTNEIARLELGLRHVAFEKKKDGYFTGSNIAEDLKILRFETRSSELDIKESSVARRVRWKQLMKQYAGKIDIELAEQFEADHFDAYLNKENPCGRTLCDHDEIDDMMVDSGVPFSPGGTYDGKVVDSKSAKNMTFYARWGSACGKPFYAKEFLEAHPQFDWMESILKDRPSQPWTEFKAGN